MSTEEAPNPRARHETAAAASYARRLVKEKDAGKPLGLAWDSLFTTVYDDAGANITGDMSFVLDGTVDVPAAAPIPTESTPTSLTTWAM